jgi:hypothetical protein
LKVLWKKKRRRRRRRKENGYFKYEEHEMIRSTKLTMLWGYVHKEGKERTKKKKKRR